jgi:hypothetical protein
VARRLARRLVLVVDRLSALAHGHRKVVPKSNYLFSLGGAAWLPRRRVSRSAKPYPAVRFLNTKLPSKRAACPLFYVVKMWSKCNGGLEEVFPNRLVWLLKAKRRASLQRPASLSISAVQQWRGCGKNWFPFPDPSLPASRSLNRSVWLCSLASWCVGWLLDAPSLTSSVRRIIKFKELSRPKKLNR